MHAPELHDGSILLRALTLADAAAHLAGEDGEISRRLGEGERSTPATVTAWIERTMHSWQADGPVFTFGIRRRETDELIGHIDANTGLDMAGVRPGEANLSYSLHDRARGNGYATRAVELVCGYLIGRGVPAAVIRVELDNHPSIAVARRSGFTRSGVVRGSDGTELEVWRRELDERR